jgi:hypothetical protein
MVPYGNYLHSFKLNFLYKVREHSRSETPVVLQTSKEYKLKICAKETITPSG